MVAELVHVGAVIAFGGAAGTFWVGLRTQHARWVIPCWAFIVLAAFAAGYR